MESITHATRPKWVQVEWPYNSAIKIPCWKNGRVILHVAFECTDTEANEGLGAWTEGEGFQFTVKGSHSGRCPEHIKTLEEAMDYIDDPRNAKKVY